MKGSLCLSFIGLLSIYRNVSGFLFQHQHQHQLYLSFTSSLRSVSVPISELEKDLTPYERSITSVVRQCGPSVTYVTSVLSQTNSRRRNVRDPVKKEGIPSGRSLGSGSGFQISPGYVCTNYHVIERAYSIQQTSKEVETIIDMFSGNVSRLLPGAIELINATTTAIFHYMYGDEVAAVYVRIDSEKLYKKCRIVNVEPDLDLAVLKIESQEETDDSNTVEFGSSSTLLVGQTVVAIGNPFALDNTVTTGVVSAVNRELRAGTVRTRANIPIRNCIQTDAAINPGNSGGPLLNLKGEVVGINTAIITTSGSNAGIGFAVPSDQLNSVVGRIIEEDRIQNGERSDKGWLGVSIVKQSGNSTLTQKNWILSIEKGSPAASQDIQCLQIKDNGVQFGDAIVAVAGNEVMTFAELHAELEHRIPGEKLSLTVENCEGERRVVYVTLSQKQ